MSLMKLVLVFILSVSLMACGGGGGGSGESQGEEPRLQSSQSQAFIQGEPVSITFENTGDGELQSCEAPQLPSGLTVRISDDLQTCVVEGDAFSLLETTDIEVTATNAFGSSQATLPLSIERASPFILTVLAEGSEASGMRTFTIRHNPDFRFDYTVDWGDGSAPDVSDGSEDLSHTYAGNGEEAFAVSIRGLFPQLLLSREVEVETSMVSIDQWGNQPWRSLEAAFVGVHDLTINATDLPNLKHTATLEKMFLNAEGFDADISQWDVSNVSDMSDMFSGASLSVENYDLLLNAWSNLTLQENVAFGAGDSRFSVNGESARRILSNNFFWQIDDAGNAAPQLIASVDLVKVYTNLDAEFSFQNTSLNATSCESSDLPTGLSVAVIDGTCRLSGEPTSVAEPAQASVIAINEFGQTSFDFMIQVLAETPYVTRWKTDNEGETDDRSLTIYTSGRFDYNFTVDWGDGNIDENVTETIIHTYDIAGEYEVSITGRFPQPFFPNQSNVDAPKLLRVESFGDRPWLSMQLAFNRATNLEIAPSTAPDLSRVRDMSSMFLRASNFDSDISHWDVSNVSNMNGLFSRATRFNQDISTWDVSKVESMRFMFNSAQNFDQPIGRWDTRSLRDLTSAFREARKFNQALENWQTGLVTSMQELFDGAFDFNQPIGNWDTSSVRNMRKAFNIASDFNQDISQWDVSNVTNMELMFNSAGSFNRDISRWDVSNVSNMNNMFQNARRFDQNLAPWDVQNVAGNRMLNRTFSTENYDAMLIAWSSLSSLQEGVTLEAGSSEFSASAVAARNILIDRFGWTINDGGEALPE